jgi:hypothetical protein
MTIGSSPPARAAHDPIVVSQSGTREPTGDARQAAGAGVHRERQTREPHDVAHSGATEDEPQLLTEIAHQEAAIAAHGRCGGE